MSTNWRRNPGLQDVTDCRVWHFSPINILVDIEALFNRDWWLIKYNENNNDDNIMAKKSNIFALRDDDVEDKF